MLLKYAADHNMEIVKLYSDHDRSGLILPAGMDSTNLLDDLENKRANFTSLLVYKVRRWVGFKMQGAGSPFNE